MQRKYYIYRYYNKENEIIYVGLTSRPMQNRVKEHEKDKLKNETYRIDYATVKTRADMQLYEIYYINKYQPKYNIRTLDKKGIHISLPELEFFPYEDGKSDSCMLSDVETRDYCVKMAAGNMTVHVHNPYAEASEKYISIDAAGIVRKEDVESILEALLEAVNELDDKEGWIVSKTPFL